MKKYKPIESPKFKGWFIIPGVNNILANPLGEIINVLTKTITKGSFVGHYLRYRFQGKNYYIHRLVCTAFHGEQPKGKPFVNHIDGNKFHNAATNLEWVSVKDNVQHGYDNGLYKNKGISRSKESLDDGFVSIFGYGSLINLNSLEETIDRELIYGEDYNYNVLNSFKRVWRAKVPMMFENIDSISNGVFLDIVNSNEGYVNGIVFKVTKEEFNLLIEREVNYSVICVTNNLELSLTKDTYAFISKPEKRLTKYDTDVFIPEEYERLVLKGCKDASDIFYEDFIRTTEVSELPRVKGKYFYIENITPAIKNMY